LSKIRLWKTKWTLKEIEETLENEAERLYQENEKASDASIGSICRARRGLDILTTLKILHGFHNRKK
jgi:hypothetical protein